MKDGRRFLELARRITPEKPILMMKVGRSAEGARAAMSHTASLSGSADIHDAAFKQAGVIQVGMVEEMLNVASALIRQPLPKGRRVGIVTGGGGFGVVATDACRRFGLEIPPLKEDTIERLNKYMPPRWSHANPVDMAGDTNKSMACCGNMLKADEVDAVLAVSCLGYSPSPPETTRRRSGKRRPRFDRQMQDMETEAMDGLIERVERYQKPFIVAAVASPQRSGAISKLIQNDIHTYRSPEDGARVLAYLADYSDFLKTHRNRGNRIDSERVLGYAPLTQHFF